ncbi:hypothetical protein GA0074696_4859 [Micromonospora purpureochromogenes]|uniref:Uncharacterized protein n=1 Tax=Micromonospora purpureochromogenes TaxID=47872 RepID=A0A1C4ZT39_9ACTN|nr:hypothetical protein [Micromonospora purpureochromogenes]SCF36217.1 hypothetical protein GA0074696_4859 [Micromonospora purpureochromogenes]
MTGHGYELRPDVETVTLLGARVTVVDAAALLAAAEAGSGGREGGGVSGSPNQGRAARALGGDQERRSTSTGCSVARRPRSSALLNSGELRT